MEYAVDPSNLNLLASLAEEGLDPDLRDRICAAVDRLPRRQREVLNALFWEQETKSEIARRLGIHRVQVDVALQKGLTHLAEVLKDLNQ